MTVLNRESTTLACAAVQGLGAGNPPNLSSAVAVVTDPLGHNTSYTLDPFGRLVGLQTADGALQTWVLDAAGNPTTYIDQLGRITTMTYNSMEDMTSIRYPDNTITTYGYDSTFNLVNKITDALGHITTLTHNSSNSDLLTVQDALGHVTSYTWSNGLKQTMTDALGRVTSYNWDTVHRRESSEQNALGYLTTFGYDLAGNRISVQDPLGNITSMTFDGDRRMLTRTNAIGGVASWAYDSIGDVTRFVDELGHITSTVFHQRGLPVSVTEALGTAQQRTTTTSYDAAMNKLYVTDAMADVTSFTYDVLNRPIAVIEAFGTGIQRATTTVYDLVGNVVASVDARGTITSLVYDNRNRLVQKIEGVNTSIQRTTSLSYDLVSNLFNMTDPIATVTSLGYDALYRQTQRIDAYGLSGLQRTTTSNYDAVSNTVSVVNPIGAITSFGYDALYRKTQIVEAQGSSIARTTTMSYDAVNNTLSVANPRGVVTSYGYDALYRPITTLMAYGTSVQYAVTAVFDAVSNALSVTNGRNVTTSFGYDALNRRMIQLDAYGNSLQRTSTLVYDLDDNLTTSIDPLGFVVTRVYDALNRQVSFTNPDGGIATTQYDADDNVANSVDQLGHVSTYVFDVLNRGIQMVDARGGIVTLAYDANDNLLSLIDPVANQTQWSYDALNRATQELDPLSNVSTAVYDAIDRKTSATDKIGQRLAFNYDLLNRETSETWLNTSGVTVNNLTYTFDANDNLLSQSWPVAGVAKTSTMSWDSLDRLATVNESFGTLLTNSYDAESNRVLIQDSFGGITTRTFDALNRMATISFTGQSTALREDFAYTIRDQVAGQTRYGNVAGTSTVGYSTFTYDGVGRLTNLRHANSGGNIANFTNAYDLASRITSEVLNGSAPTTYQYDITDQLTNDSVVSYSYDLNGNRTMTGYATGPANELTSDGTWNYAYDKNGNLIQKTNISSGEVFAFGYDIRNRMVTATDTTTSSLQMQATYGYDALKQRIQKNVEMGGTATITEFAYDNGQIWADLNGSNALQTRYLRTDQVLELLAQVSSAGTATWMLVDRMGSLRNVVNGTGTLIDTISYDGFGNLSQTSSVNSSFYLWAGYRYYYENGLCRPDSSVGRVYSSTIGRWTSPDPIGFAGSDSNLWRYVGNNSLNFVDASGLFALGLPPFLTTPYLSPYWWPTRQKSASDPIDWSKAFSLGIIRNVSRQKKDGNCVINYMGTLKITALRFFLLGIDDDKTFFAVIAFNYSEKSATKVCPCKKDEVLETGTQQDLFPVNVRVYIEGELSTSYGKYVPSSKDYDMILREIQKRFQAIPSRTSEKK